jgi:hypothetical protein
MKEGKEGKERKKERKKERMETPIIGRIVNSPFH